MILLLGAVLSPVAANANTGEFPDPCSLVTRSDLEGSFDVSAHVLKPLTDNRQCAWSLAGRGADPTPDMAEVFIGPFAKSKLRKIKRSLLAEKSARRIKNVGDFAVYRYFDENVGAPGPGPGREAEIDVFIGSTAFGLRVFAFGEIAPSTPHEMKVLVKRALARL